VSSSTVTALDLNALRQKSVVALKLPEDLSDTHTVELGAEIFENISRNPASNSS